MHVIQVVSLYLIYNVTSQVELVLGCKLYRAKVLDFSTNWFSVVEWKEVS